jgi:hypothetical protein
MKIFLKFILEASGEALKEDAAEGICYIGALNQNHQLIFYHLFRRRNLKLMTTAF